MRDLPPRRRLSSHDDVEVLPESAYQLLKGLQSSVDAIDRKVDAQAAANAVEMAGLRTEVRRVAANDRSHIAKIVGIVATAAVSIVGAQRALAPAPLAPVQVMTPNALANELEACATLPESNRLVCQQAAAERDRLRRGGVPGR